jgi:hypothetical protein
MAQGLAWCREFIGVALKILGLPYNATAEDLRRRGVTLADLHTTIVQLKQQVLWGRSYKAGTVQVL